MKLKFFLLTMDFLVISVYTYGQTLIVEKLCLQKNGEILILVYDDRGRNLFSPAITLFTTILGGREGGRHKFGAQILQ